MRSIRALTYWHSGYTRVSTVRQNLKRICITDSIPVTCFNVCLYVLREGYPEVPELLFAPHVVYICRKKLFVNLVHFKTISNYKRGGSALHS